MTASEDAVRQAAYASGAPTPGLPSYVSSGPRDKSTRVAAPLSTDRIDEWIAAGKCASPAKGLRWLLQDGTLLPVRCGASNRCDYCAMFAATEAALVIQLDAAMRQPTVGITTTTHAADYSLDDFRKAQQLLWRQLRRELERQGVKRSELEREECVEYCGFMEWTTGEGARADGVRRPHEHSLVKGIDPESDLLTLFPMTEVSPEHPMRALRALTDAELADRKTCRLEIRVSELWHRFTGDAFIADARPLRTPRGAIAYLTLHHHKKRQAPPAGFRGRRLRPSKGYYEQPIPELRELARRLSADRRVEWAVRRALVDAIDAGDDAEMREDRMLSRAIIEGLRSLAANPLEVQYDLSGEYDIEEEREELVTRTIAAIKRIRSESPPVLVRVAEVEAIDETTGISVRRAIATRGALCVS